MSTGSVPPALSPSGGRSTDERDECRRMLYRSMHLLSDVEQEFRGESSLTAVRVLERCTALGVRIQGLLDGTRRLCDTVLDR